MPTDHDVAIRWNNSKSSLKQLKRAGSVSIHARPLHFLCPGGIVAIVSRGNRIQLVFRAAAIEGPQRVTLANGKSWPKGYRIRADRRTIRQPHPAPKSPIRGWHAIGAFRYFDAAKMRAVLVTDARGQQGEYVRESEFETYGTSFRPHVKGIPGVHQNNREAQLVDQYVSWMHEGARFGHNYIRQARLFVDLFDLTHWQLIEAKASTARESLRMAIGQLRDYKRFYARPPSLAVLLSSRPTRSCITLLTNNRISVIWKTKEGRFRTMRWQDHH